MNGQLAKYPMEGEPETPQERRRYALLAAAAELHRRYSDDNWVDVSDCVNTATLLLAEVERREKRSTTPRSSESFDEKENTNMTCDICNVNHPPYWLIDGAFACHPCMKKHREREQAKAADACVNNQFHWHVEAGVCSSCVQVWEHAHGDAT